jgi:alpha-L-rhamnosidase
MDVAAFTRRQVRNASDAQSSSGVYPAFAPTPITQSEAVPGFADGAVILPWTSWRRYGDVSIIEDNWQGMRRYVQSILENNPDFLWRNKRFPLGDWLAVDAKQPSDPTTPADLVSTAYWSHSVYLMAQMAEVIGRSQEAVHLRGIHKRIHDAFNRSFVQTDGQVGNGSQTSYVLGLKYGLVAQERCVTAAQRLVADIRRRGNALSTGFIGTQYLLDVLVDTGYASVAYDLLLKMTYPSWGNMIANGATTIWESWNGRVWASTDTTSMPNSKNHFALGSVCGFIFRRIAGIDAYSPGFETVVVRPVLDSRVKKGGGEYESIVGKISVDWTSEPDRPFTLDITLPANTAGRIHLPARRGAQIQESRKNIARHRGVRIVNEHDQETVVEVGSGTYRFAVTDS